jgi:hypothetical protein
LKRQLRQLFNAICKRIDRFRKDEVVRVVKELSGTSIAARRFEIARKLRLQHSSKGFELRNLQGWSTQSPSALINLASQYYWTFFNPPSMDLVDPWEPHEGPLENPIIPEELETALRRSKKGRAAGPDGIPIELLKYGGEAVSRYRYAMWKMRHGHSLTQKLELQLYNVVIVHAYQLEKLESAPRIHLGRILGKFFPETISNVALYRRAGVEPLRCDIARARMLVFRKILLKSD